MYKIIIYFYDIGTDGEYIANWDIIAFKNKSDADNYYENAKKCVWYNYKEIIKVVKDY